MRLGGAPKARVGSNAVGERIEAPMAPKRQSVGRGYPLPTRGEARGRGCALLLPQNCRFLSSKRRVLMQSGTDKHTFDRPGVSIF